MFSSTDVPNSSLRVVQNPKLNIGQKPVKSQNVQMCYSMDVQNPPLESRPTAWLLLNGFESHQCTISHLTISLNTQMKLGHTLEIQTKTLD